MRILIVGGYGTFGGRLVELVENEARLTLLVAGRSLARAQAYCAGRGQTAAVLEPCRFDRDGATAGLLASLQPDLVVDASGPFQAYGEKPYKLVELCIARGVHYLDLADGAEFVAGIAQFDDGAKAADVFVLSGVSSFTVLTAAVVRELSANMTSVQSIEAGIAPSPFAGVGANVVRAIASYSGQATRLKRHGRDALGYAMAETRPFVIAPPGRLPLEWRRFSLVDVPDLRALPPLWPALENIWTGAAPVPAVLHRALNAFAWLVKIRLLPGLAWMSEAMHFVTEHAQWGEHRGGMYVEVKGADADGRHTRRTWHLLAEGDDGPLIPCMAMEAVIRNMLAGKRLQAGARAAVADISLEDYERLFRKRTIYTGIRDPRIDETDSLYRHMLGDAWQQLAAPIRELHTIGAGRTFAGRCTVRRGRNPLARLIAGINGFPPAVIDGGMTLRMERRGDRERWERQCNGNRFASTQSRGQGRSQWLLRERFGPLAVDMALLIGQGHLRYVVRRWSMFGIPMPLALGPRLQALESVQDGLFKFDVAIGLPLVGLLVHYTGTLAPA